MPIVKVVIDLLWIGLAIQYFQVHRGLDVWETLTARELKPNG